MISARSEKEAAGAALLFNVLHYALRPWPWILIAFASMIVFPDLASIAERFPHVPEQVVRNDLAYPAMLTFLPAGLLGLVVTSLAAAYMSTMSSQVNWGSSIVVNDLYHRFINPEASESQQVWVGRIATVVLMIVACTLALFLENALQVFNIVLQIGAGTGLIFILRWFWWRVNAEAELTAMIVSFVVALVFTFSGGMGLEGWEQLLVGVIITTIAWVSAAYIFPSTDEKTLVSFYKKIRPGGRGWTRVAGQISEDTSEDGSDFPLAILGMVVGSGMIYGTLFATGYTLYGQTMPALIVGAFALACAFGLWKIWPKMKFD